MGNVTCGILKTLTGQLRLVEGKTEGHKQGKHAKLMPSVSWLRRERGWLPAALDAPQPMPPAAPTEPAACAGTPTPPPTARPLDPRLVTEKQQPSHNASCGSDKKEPLAAESKGGASPERQRPETFEDTRDAYKYGPDSSRPRNAFQPKYT